jgi:hypothetical protein
MERLPGGDAGGGGVMDGHTLWGMFLSALIATLGFVVFVALRVAHSMGVASCTP